MSHMWLFWPPIYPFCPAQKRCDVALIERFGHITLFFAFTKKSPEQFNNPHDERAFQLHCLSATLTTAASFPTEAFMKHVIHCLSDICVMLFVLFVATNCACLSVTQEFVVSVHFYYIEQ